LRAAGCVYAEDEAREILRVLSDAEAIQSVVAARAAGHPLEQTLGCTRFMGLEIAVTDGVFVPRLRTTDLVRAALAAVAHPHLVVDLGCGTGALAAALSRSLAGAKVHACDIGPRAVQCARRNALAHGFTVHEGAWWDALPETLRGSVDLAVA